MKMIDYGHVTHIQYWEHTWISDFRLGEIYVLKKLSREEILEELRNRGDNWDEAQITIFYNGQSENIGYLVGRNEI